MIRELVENAIGLVREQELANVEEEAERRVNERLVDLLAPAPASFEVGVDSSDSPERYERTREKMRAMLVGGEMENRKVEITIEQKAQAMMIPGMGPGLDQMDFDMQGMLEKILPKNVTRREMTVAEARQVIFDQECEALINQEKVNAWQSSWRRTLGLSFSTNSTRSSPAKEVAGPTSRGRACSATCYRSSKVPPYRPAMATSQPTTCYSSLPERSIKCSPAI